MQAITASSTIARTRVAAPSKAGRASSSRCSGGIIAKKHQSSIVLPATATASIAALSAPTAALAATSSGHLEPIAQVAGDVFAETGLGPALCVAGTVWVGWIVWSGTRTIKALKEELTGMGYDVDEFNRIGELKAIKRAVEDGTVDSIFDKVWYSRAAMAAGSGSIVDVQKVQAYWKGKGITVKTLADLDKVTAYMIKKYGKDAKMGMM
jgi:hypothetical protein